MTQDRIPTPEELRQIMGHCDFQTRAIVALLSSSGMRTGEAMALKWSDIDLARGIIRVRGEITKTKAPRITFISTEAMEILRAWHDHHPTYVKEKRDYVSGSKPNPDLIFPCTYSNVLKKFSRAVDRAGLGERDGSTGRLLIHLHSLRKYFRTRLPRGGESGTILDAVESMMGHEGYLNNSYVRLTGEEIEREYRAAESVLWIFKTRPINEDQLKQLEIENREIRDRYGDMVEKYADMARQIESLKAMHADLSAAVKRQEGGV